MDQTHRPRSPRELSAEQPTAQPMTMRHTNARLQGLIGLTDAVAWFGALRWTVSLPLVDAQAYDLIVDDGTDLHRVQVKTTTHRSPHGVFIAGLATRGGNQSFHTAKPFDPAGVDLLYVLTDERDRYVVPVSEVAGSVTINLGRRYESYRVAPAGEMSDHAARRLVCPA